MKKKYTKEELKKKIEEDPSLINSPRHNYDINSLLKRNPDGVTNQFAANLLMLTLEEFLLKYKNIIKKCRQTLKIDVDLSDDRSKEQF